MKPNQRIILNTAATYGRSLFGLGLALFSSRWVLNALGQTDFGIFSVVGSIIVFITFLNTIMAGSVGRHYAFAIGQGNTTEVNLWFNAALSIHLFLATVLVFVGWAVGEYVIVHTLNIPADRELVSILVFRVSLISAFFSMVSIPFVAMFMAKQHIAELSVWGILQSFMTFTLAYILTSVSSDRLLFYALGMVTILVLIQSAQMMRAIFIFRECHIEYQQWGDKTRLKEILSFAGWNMLGGVGMTLRDQGSAILLNIYFGPKVNAAFGIAKQLSSQTNQLAAAMLGALSPEITASEGRGDRERMLSLSLRSCKLGTILVMLFAIPLIAEIDYVLILWLREPPVYTGLFCRLILCTFLLDRLSSGYMLAVTAHGRIAAYQTTLGTSLLLTLPLAWLFLKLGYEPTSIGVAFIVTMAICSLGRVFWARRLFGVPASRWLTNVFFPCTIVSLSSAIAALAPQLFVVPSFLRLVLASSASIVATLLVTWFIALDDKEREFFSQNSRGMFSKVRSIYRKYRKVDK